MNIMFYYIFQPSTSAAAGICGIFVELEKGASLGGQIRKSSFSLQADTVPHPGGRFGQWNVGLGFRPHSTHFLGQTPLCSAQTT